MADGSTSVTVTVTLKDSSGTPLNGDSVALVVSNGASVNPGSIVLGSSGVASFSVTSTTPGTDSVNVTDNGTTVNNLSGQIIFDTAPTQTPSPTPTPPGYCGDQAPGSAPQLTSAVGSGSHQITLTWTQASNPVTYYLLSYGLSSGQYQYGNPNVGGSGTTSYTVDNLTNGVRYYFIVRAGNGCMPGSFSNELSAVAGTPQPTAVPTQESDSSETVTDDTSSPTISDFPTDTPEPTETPTPTPTPAAHKLAGKASTFIYLGTFIGIIILAGIFVANRRSKRKMKKIVEPTKQPINQNSELEEKNSEENNSTQ